jgi:hypothetical protein
MKIEKDAEWLRLEGKIGQLRGELAETATRLRLHIEGRRGLVRDETILVCKRGKRYLFAFTGTTLFNWAHGRLLKEDGSASDFTICLYDDWTKEA